MCYKRPLAIPKHDSEADYKAITENVGWAVFFNICSFAKVVSCIIAFVAQKEVCINERGSLSARRK